MVHPRLLADPQALRDAVEADSGIEEVRDRRGNRRSYGFDDFAREFERTARGLSGGVGGLRQGADRGARLLYVDPAARAAAIARYQWLEQRNLRWRDLNAAQRGRFLADIEAGRLPEPYYDSAPMRRGRDYVPVPVPVLPYAAPLPQLDAPHLLFMNGNQLLRGEYEIERGGNVIFRTQDGAEYPLGQMNPNDILQIPRGYYHMLGRSSDGALGIFPAQPNGRASDNRPVAVQGRRLSSLDNLLPDLAASGVTLPPSGHADALPPVATPAVAGRAALAQENLVSA